VFTQGLDKPVGYLLPLTRAWRIGKDGEPAPLQASDGPAWISSSWFLRDDKLILTPGDSPMGYRLPLDSLPWAKAEDRPLPVEQDSFAPQVPLPTPPVAGAQWRMQTGDMPLGAAATAPAPLDAAPAPAPQTEHSPEYGPSRDPSQSPARHESAGEVTRTALCVEVRDPRRANGPKAEGASDQQPGGKSGLLYVFMPPCAFSRTISNCWPPSKRRRPSSATRSCSRATRPRATRA
jgi:uncharacterized protein (DUF2126 family)